MTGSLHFILTLLFIFGSFLPSSGQDQTVSNGSTTTVVNFPGSGCVYNWLNSNPAIGLPAIGTGNIPSFIAINNGTVPITATITVTPVEAVGFAYIANATLAGSSTSTNTVTVVNTATNQVVKTIQVGLEPIGVAVSPDGSKVYTANSMGSSVSVISTATNTTIATIMLPGYTWGLVVSPDGSRVYATDFNNGKVSVINTATNTVIGTLPTGANPYCVATSPNGTLLYATNYYPNTLSVVDIAQARVIATIPVGKDPRCIAVDPDGSRVYVSSAGTNSISVINAFTNTVQRNIPVGFFPEGITLSADGSRLYVKNTGASTVYVINTATDQLIANIPTARGAQGVCLTPDGSKLYVTASTANKVDVISTKTNAVIASIDAGTTPWTVGNNFITGSKGCNSTPVTFTITVNPTLKPVIKITGSFTAMNTMYGTPSAQSAITLMAENLTAGVSAFAPPGFEFSTDNTVFSNSITIPKVSSSVFTLLYVRLRKDASVGGYSGNITFSTAGGNTVSAAVKGEVKQAMLTVKQHSVIKTYGSQLVGSATSVLFTATGLQNSETIGSIRTSFGTGALATDRVGNYPGSVEGSDAIGGSFTASNYSIVYVPADILVTAARLTIKADDKTKTFGAPMPQLTLTYTGFVNNETAASLDSRANASTAANQLSPSGQYPITVRDAASSNYDITTMEGALTIYPTTQLSIPNSFTPNGDGINDLWEIKDLGYGQQCTMTIFDRYGQRVYQLNGYKAWDGTLDSKPLPAGIYYYLIDLRNGQKPFSGYLSIIR